MASNPAAAPNPAAVAAEQDECFALKLQGLSVRAIAARLVMPKSTVQDRLDAAYRDLVQPQAAEARAIEVERYDAWLARLEAKVQSLTDGESGITLDDLCKVTATLTRVSERRARLLGLDAPVAIEARGELKVTVESVDLDQLT